MTIPTPLSNALADRYQIIRELGQGGMATVYLARDVKHEREVALKVIREDLSASLGAGRFLREIKIAAQLQHPNILPLLDSGEADGRLFFVMPYVRGQSLRERLARDGELPVHEAVRLLIEIVDALADAHSHGVVHRDIKPDNVMLSGRHALVMDFGVAKAISEATGRNTITTLGIAVGTPTYMSPEQAVADPHVDHRADIYAVGVIAYEMLTGQPPFAGASPQQVLAAHVTQAPDPVVKRRPAIPAALDQVIMRCLEKRPADRFQSAAELLQALEPLATPSTGITPAQTAPLPKSATHRPRWVATAVVALIVVAVIGTLAFVAKRGPSSRGELAAMDRVPLTTNGGSYSPVISPDGKEVIYTEDRCASDTTPCSHRLIVQDVGSGSKSELSDSLGFLAPMEWSPSGAWILVRAWESPGANQPPHDEIMSHLGGARMTIGDVAALTPGGDSALAIRDHILRGARSVSVLTFMPPWTQPIDSVAMAVPEQAILVDEMGISPDGRWIAVAWEVTGQQHSVITIVDRRGRQVAAREIPTLGPIGHWIGQRLLRPIAVSGQAALERIDVNARTGAMGATDTVMLSASARRPFFSATADGSLAAYMETRAGQTSLFTLEATSEHQPSRIARRALNDPGLLWAAITPDGARIIYGLAITAGRTLQVQVSGAPFAGGAPWPIAQPVADVIDVGFSADSKRLLLGTTLPAGGTRFILCDVATGHAITMTESKDTVQYVQGTRTGFFVQSSSALVFLDDGLHERKRVAIPDSLGRPNGIVTSIANDSVLVAVQPLDFSTTVGKDFMFHLPVYATDTTGRLTRVGSNDSWHMYGSWRLPDGGTLTAANTGIDARPALFHKAKPGDPPQRIGYVPGRGFVYLNFSADGKRGVLVTRILSSDSWLIRNFGKIVK